MYIEFVACTSRRSESRFYWNTWIDLRVNIQFTRLDVCHAVRSYKLLKSSPKCCFPVSVLEPVGNEQRNRVYNIFNCSNENMFQSHKICLLQSLMNVILQLVQFQQLWIQSHANRNDAYTVIFFSHNFDYNARGKFCQKTCSYEQVLCNNK